jgi:hypothetical protein
MGNERDDGVSAGSPRVVSHGWGRIEVDGVGELRDAKLWPGGGRGWDWNETGTRHRPGIQPADVRELLDYDPDVVVLSRGRQQRLETCDETIELLEGRGVRVLLDETEAAIAAYNHLAGAGERVAGLFHTTC